MELNIQIGRNLKQIRLERNLTVNQLAELSGISGVMLSQIEKGAANPTINTIWKIANGLKVPYTALLEPPRETASVVIPSEEAKQFSTDGNCRIFCYYTVSAQRKYEICSLEVEPGETFVSPGHPPRSWEYLVVAEGTVEMTVDGQAYLLQKGESLSFAASLHHEYHNPGAERFKIFLLNDYTEV